jgi:hypothetical protein
MGAFEEELYEDMAVDEAEGAALMEDELEDFGMEELEDDFGDEFDEGFEMEAYDEEDWLEADEMDDLGFEGELEDDFEAYDLEGYEGYDGFEADDEAIEEALDDVMAYALGAEDADEFFGRLWRGIKKVASRVKRVVKRAAPVVGRIARGVSRVASFIPHPYAQAVGRVAGLVGRGAQLAQRLRAEGATEEEAAEAFAELAARDPRALPLLAGVTARTIVKSKGARMSKAARKQIVKQVKAGAKTLVAKRGPAAARALPKIAKSVKRAAVAKGASPATAAKVVRRTAAKVARSPSLTKKLAKPSIKAKRTVAKAKVTTGIGKRSYVIPGPARITITAV